MIMLEERHVYVVLEYHVESVNSEKLHGVYTTREIADKVAYKARQKPSSGYVCVLKQKIKGPCKKCTRLYKF